MRTCPRTQGGEILRAQAVELAGLARKFDFSLKKLRQIIDEAWEETSGKGESA